MVRLIGDNHIEFAGLKVSLESICERLDRSRDDLLAMRVPFGLFDAYRAAVVLNRLGNQFSRCESRRTLPFRAILLNVTVLPSPVAICTRCDHSRGSRRYPHTPADSP